MRPSNDRNWPTDEGRLSELPAQNRSVRDKVLNVSYVARISSIGAPAVGHQAPFATGSYAEGSINSLRFMLLLFGFVTTYELASTAARPCG